MKPRFPLLFLTLLLSGCATPREAASPPSPPDLPDRWSQTPATAAPAGGEWWRALGNPVLDQLVSEALAGNPDLRVAEARIRQARAARDVAAAGRTPSVETSASARLGSAAAGSGEDRRLQAGADLSWEADLFGRVRGGVRAAEADAREAEFRREETRLALVAEIAATLAEHGSARRRLAIAENNLEAQRRSAELNRRRFTAGLAGELDALTAEAQAASTAAQIPALQSGARQSAHALSILAGQPPGAHARLLDAGAALEIRTLPLRAGLPSDLLRTRPDIRRAEAAVDAARERTGVAAAELFPRVLIGAGGGVQNEEPDAWLDPLREFWSVGPSASWPLFDGGARRASVRVRAALEEQAVQEYRGVVLAALREVEDTLVALGAERERGERLAESITANRRSLELANRLFEAGQVDFLNVLNAQRSLLAAEEALALSELASTRLWITLRRALGGG